MGAATFSRRQWALALASLVLLHAGARSAQAGPPAVGRPDLDLQLHCPAAALALAEALAPLVHRWRREGVMHVRLSLDARRIGTVSTWAGPDVYREPVRQALTGVDCPGLEALHPGPYQFEIAFTWG